MRIIEKWFSRERQHPQLEKNSPAAGHLRELEGPLKAVFERTEERVEVVPGQGRSFVFVGTPPQPLGLLWIEGGRIRGLNNFIIEHRLGLDRESGLVAAIAQAYERSGTAPRYRTILAGRGLVVTPSPRLALEVERILERGARG